MYRSLSLALTTLVVACNQSPDAPTSPPQGLVSHAAPHHSAIVSAKVEREIASLRKVTAPFHRFETAADAGWGTQITGCFSDPVRGGMGYHYGNTALIDGTVEALKPELLLYEPTKNGKLRFVAVEYIVPFTAWTAAAPPQLYGQSFHRNEAFGLWVLHVWHFQHNPSGMFADWNPGVSCAFAAP
jgi:hypothetical protein